VRETSNLRTTKQNIEWWGINSKLGTAPTGPLWRLLCRELW